MSIRSPTVIIAAFQTLDIQNDCSAAIAAIQAAAEQAVKAGASIAVFPEGFLTGYTRDQQLAQERALALSSVEFHEVLASLRKCQPILVLGLIERAVDGLYNAAVIIEQGKVVGHYRKRHPNESCYQAGQELIRYDVAGLRLGLGICSDARNAEDAQLLSNQGVDAIIYPLNNYLPTDVAERWRERHLQVLIKRARQTGAWIVSADVVADGDEQISFGCTVVLDGQGTLHGQVHERSTGMVVAHVPLRAERLGSPR